MTAPIDYQAVLADLLARRAKLDIAIAAIREMAQGGAPMESGEPSDSSQMDMLPQSAAPISHTRPATANSTLIHDHSFFGMSTPEAIRKFLNMMKRPQRVSDISKALMEGGQIHARDTTTAYNNTYAALKRMRAAGEAARIKTGEWGLAEWYSQNRPKEGNE